MKPVKLPKGSLRVTRDPDLYVYPLKSSRGNQFWKVVNEKARSIGVYISELEAKSAAVSHASRFLKAPKEYRERYAAKLRSFEQVRKEQLGGITNEDDGSDE